MRWLALALLVACKSHAHVDLPPAGAKRVAIVVAAPGVEVGGLESTVAIPIERAAMTIEQVAHVRTRIVPGSVRAEVELDDRADELAALSLLRAAIHVGALPRAAAPPEILRVPNVEPVARFLVRGERTAEETRSVEDWVVRPKLLMIPSVADVESCGGATPRWVIQLDPQRLASLAVSIDQIAAIHPALPGTFDPAAFATTEIANHVRLGDVAVIRRDARPADCRAFDERGQLVTGTVRALASANLDEVRGAVTRALGNPIVPPWMHLEILPHDRETALAVDASSDESALVVRAALARVPGIEHVVFEQRDGAATRVDLVRADGASEGDIEAQAIAALRTRGMIVHDRNELVIALQGPDRRVLDDLARDVAHALSGLRGVSITESASLAVVARREHETEIGEVDTGTQRIPVVIAVTAGDAAPPHAGRAELLREDGQPTLEVLVIGDADVIHDTLAKLSVPAGYRWHLSASKR